MTRTIISTPKLSLLDPKQKYETKTRSRTCLFARAGALGTLSPVVGIPPRSRIRISQSAHGNTAVKNAPGLVSKSNIARFRGVSGIRKNGLDPATRPQPGIVHIQRDNAENDQVDEESSLPEESDDEYDERTWIDGLMGFDDQSVHDKAKRQEALTDTLRDHFSSLSVSIKQDLLDAVVPVMDNLSTTIAILQKGPDDEYRDGFVAFNDTAHSNLITVRSITEELGQFKDQSLVRLKHIVGRIETERARRDQLCASFKERYLEICEHAKDRIGRGVGQDLDRAAVAIETRAHALVNGKDKDKEKMRQKILKAFA